MAEEDGGEQLCLFAEKDLNTIEAKKQRGAVVRLRKIRTDREQRADGGCRNLRFGPSFSEPKQLGERLSHSQALSSVATTSLPLKVNWGCKEGYAATRLEDVAKRAGVTKGTIYFYFESKERAFEEMIRHMSRPADSELNDSQPDSMARPSASADGLRI
ncbi:helix-turn-helix domain-containing protein [Bradyrhizobium pachyrhizi]|uniref:helix-turn-helix domain-containing protein n=1 Tax=Bradyrhizobium pachyrhizi TaxID=280333 RepID=UPI003D15F527